jgi:hypothetical protein
VDHFIGLVVQQNDVLEIEHGIIWYQKIIRCFETKIFTRGIQKNTRPNWSSICGYLVGQNNKKK